MRWWGIAVVLVCLMLSVPAGAMTIVRASDESLVEQAQLVVVGRVMAAGPATSGAAAREYRVDVERVLKGGIGPELTVEVPGGMGADGIGRRIYGAPTFSSGERAILFLEPRPDGDFRLLHLVQGAFREVRREGLSLALRDMREVTEMRRQGGAVEAAPADAGEPARDFEAFARWIGETARGRTVSPDYRVELPTTSEGPGRISAPFALFTDDDDGFGIRWFAFDSGGGVPWHFGTGGQSGVPGGGLNEFKTAIQSWNGVSQASVRYNFAGVSGATGGLDSHDQQNVLLLNDPNDELGPLTPLCTGTLAYGGPWYLPSTRNFKGQQYHEIVNADIVINDGLECFFNGSDSPNKAAAELFAHELGHTLAIDHTNIGDALMFAFIHDDGRGAQLHNDDRNAARTLYPAVNVPPPGAVPAAPTNLTAVPLSTEEILLAWQDNSNNETGFRIEASVLDGAFVALEPPMPANTTEATVFGLDPGTGYLFRVKAVNQHGESASNVVQASTNALPGACVPGAQTLCLADGRFRVEVDWETAQATSGAGQVVPGATSDDSGLFYFFGPSNWEMLVKVLPACPVNNHFWVFAAATTNVEFFLTVTDTATTAVRTYFNPQGATAQTVTDNAAFATCP